MERLVDRDIISLARTRGNGSDHQKALGGGG